MRIALTVVLSLMPSFAFAGPIGWNYAASFEGDENPDLLYLGHHARPDSWEPSGIRQGSIYGTLTLVHRNGTSPGNAHFRFGHMTGVGVVWWDGDVPPPGGLSTTFTGSLRITDAVSGAQGAFLISGTGGITSDPMLYDFTLALNLDGSMDQERVIGGNRYRIRFSTETDNSGIWLAADVSTVTPEPGTIALASLGLGALGLFRTRRA